MVHTDADCARISAANILSSRIVFLSLARALPLAVLTALATAVALCVVQPIAAQQSDSTAIPSTFVPRNDALPHTADGHWRLISLGALAATAVIAPFDARTAALFQRRWLQSDVELKRDATAAAFMGGPGPFLLGASLYVGGRMAHQSAFADVGLHLTESVVLAASITALGKGISGRSLPNTAAGDADDFVLGRGFHKRNGAYVSFPSGHTAAAFAMASALTAEVGSRSAFAARFVAPFAYGGASVIGLARMYQNVHWASDLPVAALIGSWSGLSVVHRQHAHPTNVLDRLLLGTHVTPTCKGVALSWTTR